MPILTKAIEALCSSISPKAGISRPSDESRAIELLEALRDSSIPFDYDDIYSLAIANRWSPRHAVELAELADLISSGERVIAEQRSGWGDKTLAPILSAHES
ncbi:hypothetical protein [Eoetvoesiella caeni]